MNRLVEARLSWLSLRGRGSTIGGIPTRRYVPAMTTTRTGPADHLVLAVVFDGLPTFEFSCAAEIFAPPRPEYSQVRYRFETAGLHAGQRVEASLGIQILASRTLGDLTRADTVGVPGLDNGPTVPIPRERLSAPRAAPHAGARNLSP